MERPGTVVHDRQRRRAERLYGGDATLYLVMAADSLAQIDTWREPDRLLERIEWVVGPRPGRELPDRSALEERFGDRASRIHLLTGPSLDVSAPRSGAGWRPGTPSATLCRAASRSSSSNAGSTAVAEKPPKLTEPEACRDPRRCRRAGASDRGDRVRQEGQRHRHAAHRRADDAWPTSSSSARAASDRQVQALAGAIVDELRDEGIRPLGIEGRGPRAGCSSTSAP